MMGRPPNQKNRIKQEEFEKLCGLHCTEQEIADFFGVSKDTIDRWVKQTYKTTFAAIYREKRSLGKISLRRSQWKTAQEGNVTMQIWLGKQYLDQTDVERSERKALADKVNEIHEQMLSDMGSKIADALNKWTKDR